MQKFTRELTREIEIAGQRLSVTLNETGVSLRPVGSRRPPATLTWGAVLCAAQAPVPGEDAVAACLESLRGGKPSPAPSSASASLSILLSRLDSWLARHRKNYHAGLKPGATPEQLSALEQTLGKPLPEELRVWLNWHNGQQADLIGSFVDAWLLLSAEEIANESAHRKTEKEPSWNIMWIPLLDDGQGDLMFLDSTQPGCPVRELWQGQKDQPIAAPSLTAWTAAFVQNVEAGRCRDDPERGEFRCQ